MIARSWSDSLAWSSPRLVSGLAIGGGLLLGWLTGVASPLTALAVVIGGATVLLIPRDPGYGLYALIGLAFGLPFAVIPFRLGGQLTALEVALGLTIGATALRSLARREPLRLEPAGWLLIGVLILAGLSLILSLGYAGSLFDTGRRFFKLVLAMLVFFVTPRLVRTDRRLDLLLRSFMLCGALEAFLAVTLYFAPRDTTIRLLSTLAPLGYPTGPDVLRFLPGENDTYSDILRATGTEIDPNVLGGTLMLAAALSLSQLFTPRPLLPPWALLPMGLLTVYAMLLSHSRGSWVGLVAALLALATLRYRRLWLLAAPAALAVALLPAGRALYGRVLSGFAGQDKAAGMRLDEHRNALEIIQQYPVFGIGFGGPPSIDLAPGVSSLYLTVAETMGLPALVLYLGALAWLLTRSSRALARQLEPRRQSNLASLQTMVMAALAAGLFDHYFASTVFPHMVALFWLCCGLLAWSSEVRAPSSTLNVERSTLYGRVS